jgi:hypothetical protein
VFADQKNYVRLERGYGTFDAIAFEYFANGVHRKLTTPYANETGGVVETSADTVSLRLDVRNGQATGWWRVGATDTWMPLPGSAPVPAAATQAGLTVLNTPKTTGNFSATFSKLQVTCPQS